MMVFTRRRRGPLDGGRESLEQVVAGRSFAGVRAVAEATRDAKVLEAIASGATNREIAGTLYLSPHTVKEHTSSLYRKLGARNRAEAVQKAQRIGLIS